MRTAWRGAPKDAPENQVSIFRGFRKAERPNGTHFGGGLSINSDFIVFSEVFFWFFLADFGLR